MKQKHCFYHHICYETLYCYVVSEFFSYHYHYDYYFCYFVKVPIYKLTMYLLLFGLEECNPLWKDSNLLVLSLM
jgi:hypothetical protein